MSSKDAACLTFLILMVLIPICVTLATLYVVGRV